MAGRQLSFEQFKRAVRQPWGVMPTFTQEQISDEGMKDLLAYFATLPKLAEPAPWRTPLPPGAPNGQQLLIATGGCGQCHGPVMAMMRTVAGGSGADYNWFAKRVYEHTSTMPEDEPHPVMGNFSRARMPEPLLQEIWRYASVDLGLRVPVRAQLSAGVPAGTGVTYTLTVANSGTPGKGPTAEDLSIGLALPDGATVAGTTGAGYQGVRRDQQVNADMAVWQLTRLAPAEKHTYTITLSGGTAAGRIATGSVRWAKPLVGGAPDMVTVARPPTPQSQ